MQKNTMQHVAIFTGSQAKTVSVAVSMSRYNVTSTRQESHVARHNKIVDLPGVLT